MSKLLLKILLRLLPKLKQENKTLVVSALLEKIDALPISSMVKFDEQGTITINGNKMDMEQARIFSQSVIVLKDSFARKVINDQITFLAVQMGVHQALNPEMIMFSKCALWYIQEQEKLIERISQD